MTSTTGASARRTSTIRCAKPGCGGHVVGTDLLPIKSRCLDCGAAYGSGVI